MAAPIRNRFWYCCRECEGDAEHLRVHYVANINEYSYIIFSPFVRKYWLTSCTMCVTAMNGHVENAIMNPLSFLVKVGSGWIVNHPPAASALRDVIFDGRWLKLSILLCEKSSHGGIGRVQLAYLDHNHHLGRSQLITKDGKQCSPGNGVDVRLDGT